MATSTAWPSAKEIDTSSVLVDRARDMAPVLRRRALDAELARTLPAETISDFKKAGFFQLMQPKRFGGLEVGLDVLVDVAIELGKGCAASAWVCVVLNGAWLLAGFPAEAQHDVWDGDPNAVIGSVLSPTTDVTPVDGGYRIGGKWNYASGIDHVDWEIVTGFTVSDRGVLEVRLFIIPKGDFGIEDNWHAVGLCGTGSKTVVVKDAFVPYHRSLPLANVRDGTQPGACVNANPLYRIPMGVVFPMCLASPIVGAALGAYELWRTWMSTRLTKGIQRMAEQIPVQICLAEAGAEIECAELLLRRNVVQSTRILATHEPFTAWHRACSRRDAAYAIGLCVRAVERMFVASGGGGLFDDAPIHRAWRDIHAGAAHITFRWDDVAARYGRGAFGLEPEKGFFD